MPKAVVDESYTRYELESLPEGFVELRPMEYGDVLERNGMMLKMSSSTMASQGNRAQRRSGKQQDSGSVDFTLGNKEVTLFEYQKCIGDHNLEDKNGNLLDLKTPQGIAQLHPKIGAEIGELLEEINSWDTEGKSQ
jgi:hypothetical protein